MRLALTLLLLGACLDNPLDRPEPPCDDRGAWWSDTDSDGVGDPGAEVWVTCEDPGAGWTDVPPADDTDAPDTDDTDAGDTDESDTDDTDAAR